MDIDYIRVIDSFVETVITPILVIDDRSYVISSNKAAVDLLGNDFSNERQICIFYNYLFSDIVQHYNFLLIEGVSIEYRINETEN